MIIGKWTKFLGFMEEFVTTGKKFLVCDTVTCADFLIGALYINLFTNPNRPFYKPEYEALMKKFPNFCAWGERFRAENKAYLDAREARPC